MIFRSGEGGDEGGEVALHFTTTTVSDTAALVSSSTLEHTLEAYGQNTVSHKVFVA